VEVLEEEQGGAPLEGQLEAAPLEEQVTAPLDLT
jgi:hypothetical protein